MVHRSAYSRSIEDTNERVDVLEARLPPVALVGLDPTNVSRGRVNPRFDAAMALFDSRFGNQFIGWRGTEVIFDLGFQRRLVLPHFVWWS